MSDLVTADEVSKWFRTHRRPWPDLCDCGVIAAYINKMMGPSRVEAPIEEVQSNIPYWDFDKVYKSALLIQSVMPLMIESWRSQNNAYSTEETRTGADAINALAPALEAALPFIQWPWGRYEPTDHRKSPRRKDWHIPAIVIAPEIAAALVRAGKVAPGVGHKSVVASVVQRALSRMGFRVDVSGGNDATGAIGPYLQRWFHDKCPTQNAAALSRLFPSTTSP